MEGRKDYSSFALSQNSVFLRVTRRLGAVALRRIWIVMPVWFLEASPVSERAMEKCFTETLLLGPGAA